MLLRMWANSAWGLFGLAVTCWTLTTSPVEPLMRDAAWFGMVFFGVASSLLFLWPAMRFCLLRADIGAPIILQPLLQKLDATSRYVILSEDGIRGNDSKRQTFGPYEAANGTYGDISYVELRRVLSNLVMLGVFLVNSEGKYQWTTLGNSVVRCLSRVRTL